MVGPSGLEPPTSCLSGTRSNLLSYEPMWLVCGCSHSGLPFGKFLWLPFFSKKVTGGDDGIRTHDPLLAGQVLSQLSYTPILLGLLSPYFRLWESRSLCSPFVYVSIGLSSRTASREVFSPLQSLTSVFGMGTGGPSAFVTLTFSQ